MALKIFLTIMLPFLFVWVVISTIWNEVKSIPFYLRCNLWMEWSWYINKMKDEI